MNYSANVSKVLESFTKKLNTKSLRHYEEIIGCENNTAAITDGFSMLYFKSDELPTEKTSLDSFLRESAIKFPSYQEIIASSPRKISVSSKDIESLCKSWKPAKNQESFIQYFEGSLSLRLGVPKAEDKGLFFNPERISVYSKAIPKDYEVSRAYFANESEQLIIKYSHKSLDSAPELTLIVCLISNKQ